MTRFFKLSGGGNDFVALAEPPPGALSKHRIRRWCRRGLSIGADGLLAIDRKVEGGIRLRHFNPDGSPATLCLNGGRCAARLAFHLGWATGTIRLATDAGPIKAQDAGKMGIRLQLASPKASPRAVSLALGDQTYDGWWTRVGVPHLVFLWEAGLESAPVAKLGEKLVHHPALEAGGANVNFISCPESGRLEIRTYERGVYAETLACGTGVLSASFVLLAAGKTHLPLTALTAGGFELRVDGEWDGDQLQSWSLAGDARLIAEGNLFPGAEELPPPPVWTGGAVKASAI